MDKCYEIQPDDRLFPYTKSFLNNEILCRCKKAEVATQLENVMNGTTVPNGSQMAGVANL